MLAQLKREDLAQGIQRVLTGLPQKATLPILSYVRMRFLEKKLQLQTTDLDVFINWDMECMEMEGTLDVCIPVKRLYGILRELSSENISIESIDSTGIGLITERGKYKFFGISSDEFPSFPEFEEKVSISVKVFDMKRMLDRTMYAVGSSETREVLNGLLLLMEENCFRLVATDGRRLATQAIHIPMEKGHQMVVPRKAMLAVRSCCDVVEGEEDTVCMGFGGTHGRITMKHGSVVARLLEGDFPDYRDVIPTKPSMELKVSREALLLGCRRVGVFSGTDGTLIKVTVSRDSITLSASSTEIGEGNEVVSIVEGQGVDMELGINYRYVVDALGCLKDEEIYVDLIGSRRPVCFRSDESYRSVVMPMRLEGIS